MQVPHERDANEGFTAKLLHRWFIEYNPLYLVSAMLVLGGMVLWSRGLTDAGSAYGELGVALVAELYAAALIGGAALLTRIDRRRPAVMLALLAVAYQWDLTLHTEACAFLGAAGAIAAAAWALAFLGKLRALAWAVRLRLSREVWIVASASAIGLAVLPHAFARVGPRGASALVTLFAFAVASLSTCSTWSRARAGEARGVTSEDELDAWGRTVLRRAVAAAWIGSAILLGFHVLFWSAHLPIHAPALWLVPALVVVPSVRTEARAWSLVAAALAVAGVAMPGAFSVAALMAAVALARRGLVEPPREVRAASRAEAPQPYRSGVAPPVETAVAPSSSAQVRLLAGAVGALYLSLWTVAWTGGPWPAHVAWLDLATAAVLLAFAARRRAASALAPALATHLHLVLAMKIVPTPQTLVGWGALSVSLGFALLAAALGVTYAYARRLTPRSRASQPCRSPSRRPAVE